MMLDGSTRIACWRSALALASLRARRLLECRRCALPALHHRVRARAALPPLRPDDARGRHPRARRLRLRRRVARGVDAVRARPHTALVAFSWGGPWTRKPSLAAEALRSMVQQRDRRRAAAARRDPRDRALGRRRAGVVRRRAAARAAGRRVAHPQHRRARGDEPRALSRRSARSTRRSDLPSVASRRRPGRSRPASSTSSTSPTIRRRRRADSRRRARACGASTSAHRVGHNASVRRRGAADGARAVAAAVTNPTALSESPTPRPRRRSAQLREIARARRWHAACSRRAACCARSSPSGPSPSRSSSSPPSPADV